MEEWGKKPRVEREKLSIYDPDRVAKALLNAQIINDPPVQIANGFLEDRYSLGEWTLLLSEWGNFWACPRLRNGIPEDVLLFNSLSGELIDERDLFENLKKADTSFSSLAFSTSQANRNQTEDKSLPSDPVVIEVEHGEQWTDYRPSRPEHFVGRSRAQRSLLSFFTEVKKGKTETRVFAIKGDSGIGKSSLVAKMRDVAVHSQKPSKLFLYAVDVRAANNSSYIYSSLIEALTNATQRGFGSKCKLEISNCMDPLQSESISNFLAECKRKHELIILVFDQFEELYSKPDLFAVFKIARKLMFSTIAASTNLVLGFAWKTDSTVPQDHPAYHMWHQLNDHRYEINLPLFSHADAENSIRLFEKELGEKILPELRKYILESSQGYPWLLKKLCIHLYEQIQTGANQHQLVDKTLDIGSLFDRDLNNLTDAQMACVKIVAKNAPMDWYEVLETAGPEVVQSLQQKRIIIRRGDKLNVYWDIFKDYVISGSIPSIPFAYIPQSPSINAMLKVATQLDNVQSLSINELAQQSNLKDSTIKNIIHDLVQFGVASQNDTGINTDSHMKEISEGAILTKLRFVFRRHRLVGLLRSNNSTKPASQQQIIQYLKEINPAAHHHTRTWEAYANRMCNWFHMLGYCDFVGKSVVFSDKGDILLDSNTVRTGGRRWRYSRRRQLFIGDASPSNVIKALDFLIDEGPKTYVQIKIRKFRNACSVLHRFGLIALDENQSYYICNEFLAGRQSKDAVWEESRKEESLSFTINYLNDKPNGNAIEIAQAVAKQFDKNWKEDSCRVVGNSLKRWAFWLMSPLASDGSVPVPRGTHKEKQTAKTMQLFQNRTGDI